MTLYRFHQIQVNLISYRFLIDNWVANWRIIQSRKVRHVRQLYDSVACNSGDIFFATCFRQFMIFVPNFIFLRKWRQWRSVTRTLVLCYVQIIYPLKLIRIQPLIHKILCTQERVMPTPTWSTQRSICHPPCMCGDIITDKKHLHPRHSKDFLTFFFFFFFIWVLRPFQEYFTYIEPIVHRRWAKTGEPGEKPPDHP